MLECHRQDAVEALDFAARGKVTPRIEVCSLEQLPEGELPPPFALRHNVASH